MAKSKFEEMFNSLLIHVDSLEKEVSGLHQKINDYNEKLEARVDSLEKDVVNLSKIIDKLKYLLPPESKQVKQNSLKFR
jgi:uncharacterized protein YceH (UPF0502 family)